MDYRSYGVNKNDRGPLLDWVLSALRADGCTVLRHSPATEAPFRIAFETAAGERMGILCYAFLANSKVTKNRPGDEWRFQIKYGKKTPSLQPVWHDPYGLYTTLFMGINPDAGFFIGADPEMHNPTRFFISLEFKDKHVQQSIASGWHAWERERRQRDQSEPIEVLVGGTAKSLLRYIRFEREAWGLDQGHRQLLAETLPPETAPSATSGPIPVVPQPIVHSLAIEFQMTELEVLDLIASARMLKMAVRGWVAERHLVEVLSAVSGVSECHRPEGDTGSDVELRYEGSRLLRVQCKNVLRVPTAQGVARVDFQRTRASKKDPCSRYYEAGEFDLVAACLHALTLKWEFNYVLPGKLAAHAKCTGRLSNNVRVDSQWSTSPEVILAAAAQG